MTERIEEDVRLDGGVLRRATIKCSLLWLESKLGWIKRLGRALMNGE